MNNLIIAIDGPAGSGKTTSAKVVAEHFNYLYIDTGAMYRAVTLFCIKNNLGLDEKLICESLKNIKIDLIPSDKGQRTLLNGEDVSVYIRLPEVTKLVSPVSAMACVREAMVNQQRQIGRNKAVVMDGRDIGTVVFPDADLKIFLVATIEARAKRRFLELQKSGITIPLEEIMEQIISRDEYDSSRENSPLKKADDAIEIDTSNLSIEQQTKLIIQYAEKLIV